MSCFHASNLTECTTRSTSFTQALVYSLLSRVKFSRGECCTSCAHVTSVQLLWGNGWNMTHDRFCCYQFCPWCLKMKHFRNATKSLLGKGKKKCTFSLTKKKGPTHFMYFSAVVLTCISEMCPNVCFCAFVFSVYLGYFFFVFFPPLLIQSLVSLSFLLTIA